MVTEAYGADAVKKSSVFEWRKRFQEGQVFGYTYTCRVFSSVENNANV
jgi:hypothetical protein